MATVRETPWSSDEDENFIPAHTCNAKTSLTPLHNGNSESETNYEMKAKNAKKFERASSNFPAYSFKSLPQQEPGFVDRFVTKLGLNDESAKALKEIPFEKLITEYKNIGLPEADVCKVRSAIQEELIKKWDPSSLLQELDTFQGLNAFNKTGSLSSLKMCYFVQNLNVHLLTMREETIELQSIVSRLRESKESGNKGLDDPNNIGRMREMIVSGRGSCLKLEHALGDLLNEIGKRDSIIVRFCRKSASSIRWMLIVGGSLCFGFWIGKRTSAILIALRIIFKFFTFTKKVL